MPPIFLVVNKCESKERRDQAAEFYELGLGDPFAISAIHGTNTGDLLDALVASFPERTEEEEDDNIKIAIVGKPNAGKSSLLNRLVGEERVIVSPIAGTTRDSIDTQIEFQGIPVTLIDTAGIRRRGKIEKGVEEYSVIRSLKSIERADVSLLMIDATTGITAQDAHIAGYIKDEWKSCVVLVNKWDAVEKDGTTMDAYTEKILNDLNFMSYVPILYISAKTRSARGPGPADGAARAGGTPRPPDDFHHHEIIHNAQDAHPHPSHAGRLVKMFYGTQVRSDPPTFMIYVNDPKLIHFTYLRYLENQIRKEYGFLGTPIRIVTKGRRE
jgi:ribosome-associated GTPase EngA